MMFSHQRHLFLYAVISHTQIKHLYIIIDPVSAAPQKILEEFSFQLWIKDMLSGNLSPPPWLNVSPSGCIIWMQG